MGKERSGPGFLEYEIHYGDDGGVGGDGDGECSHYQPSILPQKEFECAPSSYRLLPRQSLRVCHHFLLR